MIKLEENLNTTYRNAIPKSYQHVPTRGNIVSKTIAAGLIKLLGWKFEGNAHDVPKQIFIAAPHTSNWDGIIAVLTMLAIGMHGSWVVKHTVFRFPFRTLMSWAGGLPINRDKSKGFVEKNIEIFDEHDNIILIMAPEGTRKKVSKWKSGFYHIAVGANVPIGLGYMDYSRKTLGLGPLFYPTGDYEKDLAELQTFYANFTAKHVDQY